MRQRADPFAALGLLAAPDLTDDDVRSAWRRAATATHPDRADGGDPERFAAAAAAYTSLRTTFGRGEALADLRAARPRRVPPGRGRARTAPGRRTRARREWLRPVRGRLAPGRPRPGRLERGRLAPGRAAPWWLALARLGSRVRRGRPARLALRATLAAAAGWAAVAAVGSHPAAPALITGTLTWFVLTARHDLAPPG